MEFKGYVIVLIFLFALSGAVYAKPDFATATGKACNFCHPEGPPVLGPAGEYFKEHQTLDGYGGEVKEEEISPFFPCSQCHATRETNVRPRELTFHKWVELKHMEVFWCLDCHNAEDRDKLILINGENVSYEDSPRLCGQCHGPIYNDWKEGIHGKRTGLWNGNKDVYICVKCHNPHNPPFESLKPEAPPEHPAASPTPAGLPILAILGLVIFAGLIVYAARK